VSLLIEVKGYPSSTYRSGVNEGQKKMFGVGAQARNSFGNAVLTALLMRSDNSTARVVLAFPTFETFRTLARRCGRPLQQAGIEIWLVDERGVVTEDVGVDNHSSKFEWQPGDVVLLDSDDVKSAPDDGWQYHEGGFLQTRNADGTVPEGVAETFNRIDAISEPLSETN
jgi:hypothetical protein